MNPTSDQALIPGANLLWVSRPGRPVPEPRSRGRSALLSGVLACLWLPACPGTKVLAQEPMLSLPEGYGSTTRHHEPSGPFALHGVASDLLGQRLYFARSHQVFQVDPAGTVSLYFTLAHGDVVGLLKRPHGSNELLITSTRHQMVIRLPFLGGPPASQPILNNLFDLELAPDGSLVASANPNWPAPGARNGIWRLDPGGNHREILSLPGPSGPLAFDSLGNLYYAVQSSIHPTPPGAVYVRRFAAAAVASALAGGPALTEVDGVIVLSGLDGAYSMVFDDRQRLYLSDPHRGVIERSTVGVSGLDPRPLLVAPPAPHLSSVTAMAFVDGGQPTFDAFQPDLGGHLFAVVTNQTTDTWLVRLHAERPLVTDPGPVLPGPLVLDIQSMPARGALLLWWSPHGPTGERALAYFSGIPLWCGIALDPIPWALTTVSDGSGAARVPLLYPGGFSGSLTLQAFGLGPAGQFASAAPVVLTFRP